MGTGLRLQQNATIVTFFVYQHKGERERGVVRMCRGGAVGGGWGGGGVLYVHGCKIKHLNEK